MSVQHDMKVRICCVVGDYEDLIETPKVEEIKEQALKYGMSVSTRLYDARKNSVDRYEVTKLPAFHIFVEQDHIKTFYPNPDEDANIYLEEGLDFYRKRQRARKTRAETWTRFMNWLSGQRTVHPQMTSKNKSQ
jgi:hypothetical protein